ncbi:HpcH/HpaI aldolase/citrate lyase family protein [Aquicoccus sp. G2-2]|uniref:HpcH/HpaI aldolase family protein n=1 Tax=Aquicoccus sp. G2-2 TaxID=3092120 RepID=UPI002ADFEFA4|nr:HpcH/HpaI aldolase/citrate lyase family protein [Aquicoccus sp. G2-2]MEA1112237.1 HpcH/HpaI aldolase/citrate lyase family protein [Aquicoccus sp. G2-2]
MTTNHFKRAIARGERQVGIWHSLRDRAITEMLGDCGFDWLLIDCEHTPNSEADVLAALQALSGSATEPVVRPTHLEVAEIKRLLDVGARNLLVPYVQSVEEAELAAAAVAYPPEGIRGVSTGSRASRYGAVATYFTRAREEICLIVQVETQTALDRLEEIAAVPGIDGIFIGPADLAASMGHPGNPKHPDVHEAILTGMARIRAAGKPAGFLSRDQELLEEVVTAGGVFIAVDTDMALLREGALGRLERCSDWKSRG